jgi:hypothetical protein
MFTPDFLNREFLVSLFQTALLCTCTLCPDKFFSPKSWFTQSFQLFFRLPRPSLSLTFISDSPWVHVTSRDGSVPLPFLTHVFTWRHGSLFLPLSPSWWDILRHRPNGMKTTRWWNNFFFYSQQAIIEGYNISWGLCLGFAYDWISSGHEFFLCLFFLSPIIIITIILIQSDYSGWCLYLEMNKKIYTYHKEHGWRRSTVSSRSWVQFPVGIEKCGYSFFYYFMSRKKQTFFFYFLLFFCTSVDPAPK